MLKRMNICVFMCFLFIAPVLLSAQTAAELEVVLGSSALTCSQAARFVLASVGSDASAENDATAFESAMNRGWLPRKAAADDPISLGALSFLIMQSFGLKGGMMYAIFPGPRYAFRSMVSRSFIQGAADPAMTVGGERFLLILGNVLNAAGGEE